MPKAKQPIHKKQDDTHISQLEGQVQELTEALQRERADAINLRRRHDEEVGRMRQYATIQVARELLPVIDNFERALKHIPQELATNDYVKGVATIVKQFEQVLAKIGVERIKTVGEQFNPTYHEAVGIEEGDGQTEVVSEELQAGYTLGDEVIRHAMVKVVLK